MDIAISTSPRARRSMASSRLLAVLGGLLVLLSACGGSDTPTPSATTTGTATAAPGSKRALAVIVPAPVATTARDAVRLADQASFGPTEALVADIRTRGPANWVASQLNLDVSRYTRGGTGAVHQNTNATEYCNLPANQGENCWRDNYSSEPLLWDFYRNAMTQPDQLRQRMAWALQQILVISGVDLYGTYGLRSYHSTLLAGALGNYRDLLKAVTLSPVMGDYLNNVNNDRYEPNENFARELMQLFSIGTCQLNADGTLVGGRCTPTYDNEMVRNYAFALTGWTYPAGGATFWGCWPQGANCQYYAGNMVAVASRHDPSARTLLAGTTLAAGHTATSALETVLDSLIKHPNTAPFISRQLIQHLVTSNPSPAYVGRVAAAFSRGSFVSGGTTFGAAKAGDLTATVAAILLDAEARNPTPTATGGRLREPVLMFTGVLRAMNGVSDGDALSWWWGETLRQHAFRPPTVFSYYLPDHPVAGTTLAGPAFGIHSADTALERLNFLYYLFDVGGGDPDASVPGALGTKVALDAFLTDAADAAKLVDRLSMLAMGQVLPTAPRTKVLAAVNWWTATTDPLDWRANRVRTAAYLVFASPEYQVQR